MGELDPSFLALPLDRLRAAALERALALGCKHAEVRVERIRSQVVQLRDAEPEMSLDNVEIGIGLRVVHEGALGFAATVDLSAEAASRLADEAVRAAKTTAQAVSRRVELAGEPGHGEVSWVSAFEIDPTTVAVREKRELLGERSRRLLSVPGIDHVTASLLSVAEDKYFADLAGTVSNQRRVRVRPLIEALSVDGESGDFETMRTLAPPAGRGYEYVTGNGWDWDRELDILPILLAEKRTAPSVQPATYDLVIDPTNLWLAIHESIGHATELDRAMGYEASFAGTSFATFDQLGSLRYGSEAMNVTADRTTPHGLSTIGYDDEGVQTGSFDIVRGGILVGYQMDRQIAAEQGLGRSNGCAFGSSALQTPLQRMANISLAPAPSEGPGVDELISRVERGIYVVGDGGWSIDMQRENFQFTGQRYFKIERGRLTGQVKDVVYQGQTTEFWASMEAVGGWSTYRLEGCFRCGKGEPRQFAPVSHGCPAAIFRGVRVLNAREESGR
jgi:TldD protein